MIPYSNDSRNRASSYKSRDENGVVIRSRRSSYYGYTTTIYTSRLWGCTSYSNCRSRRRLLVPRSLFG